MQNSYITLEEAKTIKLSKNFTLDEFLKSTVALRKGIDNSMPREYLPRIQFLVDTILQPVRDKFGPMKVTSGYRNVDLCIALGSNAESNHARGLAVDIEPYDKDIRLIDILIFINDKLEYKELIAEYFPHGWVHVAASEVNNKRDLKLKDNKHHYSSVNIDTITDIYVS